MIEYRKASIAELEQLWNQKIAENPDDGRYLRWKAQFIADNVSGAAATFLIIADGKSIGEGTLLLSPDCRAIRQRTCLCDGKYTANINDLRIEKDFEGLGHISKLMRVLENYARDIGLTHLTIGVEAAETRNLGIYLHWGYDEFILSEEEDGALVLYYQKKLPKERTFFLTTPRIGFSKWCCNDLSLAESLWGNPQVTRYICASGEFSKQEIAARLQKEIENDTKFHVQYWPIFDLETNELIGCCGLRPHLANTYELGFHLRPEYWGQGYATEAAKAAIDYAFTALHAEGLFAGHNPNNIVSKMVLSKLCFVYIGDEFYEPTGLYHPSYERKP